MKTGKLLRRFLFPQPVTSLYYLVKYGAKMSWRAEVDLTPNLRFGRKCTVSSFTKIKALSGPLTIGDRSGFATGCFVSTGGGGIVIGDHFICGPNVNIVASNYDYSVMDVHLEDLEGSSKGIRIGRNVWIGGGSSVVDGAEIGDNTIVVAGSLVNRKYPPNVILQGSPAKVIMKRSKGE